MVYVVQCPGNSSIELDPGASLDTVAVDEFVRQDPLSILIAAEGSAYQVARRYIPINQR